MDREYLEDYEHKENEQYEKFLKDIQEDRFNFEKDRYPPDKRFIKLQEPVTVLSSVRTTRNFWAQVPFCGSLVLGIDSLPERIFEKTHFSISEIPKIVDFVKETGRLQIGLCDRPTSYKGFDFLDPIFELDPPILRGFPLTIFGTEKEISIVKEAFSTLGDINYFDYLQNILDQMGIPPRKIFYDHMCVYVFLKLGGYTIGKDIDSLMVDNPEKARSLFQLCKGFIVHPLMDARSDLMNFTFEEIRWSQNLPFIYRPERIQFPCEIGKFLLRKLTYAAQDIRACNNLIDNYNAYDLRKIQKSLNEAILTNQPDIIDKSVERLSEILDNVWNDKTIPKRIKGLEIGVPLSVAALGSVAGGPIGAVGGFLAGLGFDVLSKSVEIGAEGLSERIAKWRTKSYQANIYDFKKKYKHRIVKE